MNVRTYVYTYEHTPAIDYLICDDELLVTPCTFGLFIMLMANKLVVHMYVSLSKIHAHNILTYIQ